jgi:hypothetical protein
LITATDKASSLCLVIVVVLLFKLCCSNRFICVLLFVLVFLLVKLAEVSLVILKIGYKKYMVISLFYVIYLHHEKSTYKMKSD